MDLRLKKIREWENDGYLKFEYIETENNLADLFTKPLSKKRFEELKKRIMEPEFWGSSVSQPASNSVSSDQ